jgi:hypothetical protein
MCGVYASLIEVVDVRLHKLLAELVKHLIKMLPP